MDQLDISQLLKLIGSTGNALEKNKTISTAFLLIALDAVNLKIVKF